MKHDNEWLDTEAPSYATGSIAAEIDYRRYARDYHERMNRLRSVDEAPSDGDPIVTLSQCGTVNSFRWSSALDEFSLSTVGWFLLPEGFKL